MVVDDTSPINYLVLIDCIDLLPRLFVRVALPREVLEVLNAVDAPARVRTWIAVLPPWLEIYEAPSSGLISGLDPGEAAAIVLAESIHADLLLIDERDGSRVARNRGLRVTGTLGLLDLAADRGLVNFREAIQKLERTTFQRPASLLQLLLSKHAEKSNG